MQKFTIIFILCFICGFLSAQDIVLQDPISIEFRQDTMMIEQRVSDIIEKDHSPEGLIKASVFLEQGYDSLIEKYYKILLDKLKAEDKNTLIESQQNWKKYRDSEKKMLRLISSDAYTSEGSFWAEPVAASTSADISRDRLIDIYHYLVFNIVE